MQIVCVESVCSDEKTTRFLDNAPGRLGIKGTVLFAPVQVQAEACAEADGAHDGPVRSAILGWMSISKLPRIIYFAIIITLCGMMPIPGGYSLMRT